MVCIHHYLDTLKIMRRHDYLIYILGLYISELLQILPPPNILFGIWGIPLYLGICGQYTRHVI